MARKVQISREVIMKAAFEMLLEEGYVAINITSLAKRIGCSTQPIAWHFGNMEGLRDTLLEHCLELMKDSFSVEGNSASDILLGISLRYINLAIDSPNLYKYLYMSEYDAEKMLTVACELRSKNHDRIINLITEEYGISTEQAEKYIMDLQLYVHGIASYAVTKISHPSKEVIMEMVNNANQAFLKFYKN